MTLSLDLLIKFIWNIDEEIDFYDEISIEDIDFYDKNKEPFFINIEGTSRTFSWVILRNEAAFQVN